MPLNPIKARNVLTPAKARHKADANKVPWVPVLASTGQPLMPCHPARARELVRKGLATKSYLKGVFHIKLTQRTTGDTQVVALGVNFLSGKNFKYQGVEMKDATRQEAITWAKANNCNFRVPVYPPPSGWMWGKSKDRLVLVPIFTMTDQGGDITHTEVGL